MLLTVSPLALAKSTTLAPELCASSKKDEKSPVDSGDAQRPCGKAEILFDQHEGQALGLEWANHATQRLHNHGCFDSCAAL